MEKRSTLKKGRKVELSLYSRSRCLIINQLSGVGNIDEIAHTKGINGDFFTSLDWCTTSAPGVLVVWRTPPACMTLRHSTAGMASLKQMQTLLETLQKFHDCNPNPFIIVWMGVFFSLQVAKFHSWRMKSWGATGWISFSQTTYNPVWLDLAKMKLCTTVTVWEQWWYSKGRGCPYAKGWDSGTWLFICNLKVITR